MKKKIVKHLKVRKKLQAEIIRLKTELEDRGLVIAELREAVAKIRKSDCGAWLKNCSGVFTCADGNEKRRELSILLDVLYNCGK